MKDGGYLVVIAVCDDAEVVDIATLSAPRAEGEPDSLAGLATRAKDVLRDNGVKRLALWHYEGTPGGVKVTSARPVLRAEGVVLAAAGAIGVDVLEISAGSERRKAGLKKNEELVTSRVALMEGSVPPVGRRAVAAASYL